MIDVANIENQIHCVTNFHDLVSITFYGEMNAICWKRELIGDFSEIVQKIEANENIKVIEEDELTELELSEQGKLARDIIINDFKILKKKEKIL